ncbi:hypothetical protein EV183_004881 [Coemansia sp. RSA 2336]|nr:hypothetical protein EV183_004881 [Coemansia sp. RSA 2336]
MTTNVLLVGAGALGSIYAWRLQEGGVHVTCVCRSNYSTVQSQGFSIGSEAYGQHTYRPSRVVSSVDEAVANGEVYDFIIFCTKALPNLSDNSHIIAPAVSQSTIVMLIQNGIGIEEPFVERYPETPLVSVIAYIDVSQPQSGTIEHGNFSILVMGLHNPAKATPDVQDRVEKLNSVWNQNGVMCMMVEHIQAFRWLKLVWNASFNTVSVVSGGNNTREMLADPHCKQLIRNIMEEVYAIGEAATGAPLPVLQGKDSPDAFIEDTENRQVPVEPSMLMDFRAKRPMEHDVILRRPLEVARKLGISAPYMEAVYAMLVMVEKSLAKL